MSTKKGAHFGKGGTTKESWGGSNGPVGEKRGGSFFLVTRGGKKGPKVGGGRKKERGRRNRGIGS